MRKYSKAVLLIDDNADDLFLFSRELKKLGFKVVATSSAEQAMSAIVAGSIGCIVTDQVMPVPGSELVNLIYSVRGDIAAIFLSGAAPQEPLPSGAAFVDKRDMEKLRTAVQGCMACWQDKG